MRMNKIKGNERVLIALGIIGICWILIGAKAIYGEEYNKGINTALTTGFNNCNNTDSVFCQGVITQIDEICKYSYFPVCFGDGWKNWEFDVNGQVSFVSN